MEPAPLTTVALVFQSKPTFRGLPHVVSAVSLFLDTLVEIPLHVASKFGSVVLLDRIWSYSNMYDLNSTAKIADTSWTIRKYLRTDPHYRQFQFRKSMMEAARQNDVEMARWLVAKFPEAKVTIEVVTNAVSTGSLEILQVFYDRSARDPGLYVHWGKYLLKKAVRSRSIEVVEWVYTHFPSSPWEQSRALEAAVCSDNITMIEWLLDHGATWRTQNLPTRRPAHSVVEKSGSVEMLQLLDKHGQLEGLQLLVIKGAGKGFIDTVRWLLDRETKDGELEEELAREARFAVHTAASNGRLTLAKYLQSRACIPADSESRDLQRDQDQKRLRQFKDSYGLRLIALEPSEAMLEASKKGFLDVVQWLYTEFGDDDALFTHEREWGGDHVNTRVMDEAAKHGHLDVLQYLHEVQLAMKSKKRKRDGTQARTASIPECTSDAMSGAARNGYLMVVQWLHNSRSECCSGGTMVGAARNGHLEVVEWLFTNLPDFEDPYHISTYNTLISAMGCAAENGHFEVVKYLHWKLMCSESAPSQTTLPSDWKWRSSEGFEVTVMDSAAKSGNVELVKWLHYNTMVKCTTSAMDQAAQHGQLDILKWLHFNTTACCTTAAMDQAAQYGHLHVLKWLHFNTTACCTTAAMDQAAQYGHLHVLKWLHLNRTEGCTEKATGYAAVRGDLRMLQWLHSQWPTVCSSEALDSATWGGHFEVVLFLHSHYAVQLTIGRGIYNYDEDLRAWVERASIVRYRRQSV